MDYCSSKEALIEYVSSRPDLSRQYQAFYKYKVYGADYTPAEFRPAELGEEFECPVPV